MAEDREKTGNTDESVPEPAETALPSPEQSDLDLLKTRLAELEANAAQFKDQFLRKAADFDNYKRRVENDYSSMVKFSNEELITRLIPILDDFERSFQAAKKSVPGTFGSASLEQNGTSGPGDGSFVIGVGLIYSKLKKLLEQHGVKELEVLGKPFDPMLHDALLQIPREDVAPHTVVEVVEKGYLLHEKVIRHARVIVSADTSDMTPSEGTEGTSN